MRKKGMSEQETVILSNQIKCLSCGDKPYSAYRNDFKSCKCGKVNVDGGQAYLRRVGEPYKDMSIVWDKELVDNMGEAIDEAIDTGRNNFGIVCAVSRCLRDNGYEIVKEM